MKFIIKNWLLIAAAALLYAWYYKLWIFAPKSAAVTNTAFNTPESSQTIVNYSTPTPRKSAFI